MAMPEKANEFIEASCYEVRVFAYCYPIILSLPIQALLKKAIFYGLTGIGLAFNA